MMEFDISELIPRFILQDRNGYALSKAIEAGIRAFLETLNNGLDALGDVDKMPEWRLDELAWEYNIPYDYNAGIHIKREWIRNVHALSRLYGTPEGITKYMEGYFDSAILQESWEYGGEPFHFRMLFPGTWTPENVKWATTAIEIVKNVRSILDSYTFTSETRKNLFAGCAVYTKEAGTFQIAAVDMGGMSWYEDELGNMLLDEYGVLLIVEG